MVEYIISTTRPCLCNISKSAENILQNLLSNLSPVPSLCLLYTWTIHWTKSTGSVVHRCVNSLLRLRGTVLHCEKYFDKDLDCYLFSIKYDLLLNVSSVTPHVYPLPTPGILSYRSEPRDDTGSMVPLPSFLTSGVFTGGGI
jgi:hypothetical protein